MPKAPLAALTALLILQAGCAAFFAFDAAHDLTGAEGPVDIPGMQILETLATSALCFSVWITWRQIRALRDRHDRLHSQIAAASGAFADVLDAQFDAWNLTGAERDVALLAIKGLSQSEIAAARGSAPGTVKAQTAAIYRKSGLPGRPQLISYFIEELMAEPLTAPPSR